MDEALAVMCVQVRPAKHVFTADKAQWFVITDDLPQFPGFPE
ncbi:hypothetical protein [Pandoraea sp.]